MKKKKKKIIDPANPYLTTTKAHVHEFVTAPAREKAEQEKRESERQKILGKLAYGGSSSTL